MDFGAHLPLMDFGGNRYLLGDLVAYARTARKLGFGAVSVIFVLLLVRPVEAYIGPRAGFAVLGSFLVMFTTMLAVVVTIFTWPIRYIFRSIRGRRALARSRVKKFVILGLDGMDPDATEK